MSEVVTSDGFVAAHAAIADIDGWLSDGQARHLWESARRIPSGGRIVEIGSFRGRSTIVLARAAAEDVEIVAIDPHGGGDRGPQEISPDAQRGEEDHAAFRANLERAGVAERVRHVRLPSGEAAGEVRDQIDLLYIDGAHRYAPASDDIRRWGARVEPGGTLLIHDAFNAIGVMLAQARLLFLSPEFRYLGRTRSLAEYRREPVAGPARAANAGRQLAQLPWFLRILAIKLALTLHAPGVARLLGHHGGDWPY